MKPLAKFNVPGETPILLLPEAGATTIADLMLRETPCPLIHKSK